MHEGPSEAKTLHDPRQGPKSTRLTDGISFLRKLLAFVHDGTMSSRFQLMLRYSLYGLGLHSLRENKFLNILE